MSDKEVLHEIELPFDKLNDFFDAVDAEGLDRDGLAAAWNDFITYWYKILEVENQALQSEIERLKDLLEIYKRTDLRLLNTLADRDQEIVDLKKSQICEKDCYLTDDSAYQRGVREGFCAAREVVEKREHDDFYETEKYPTPEDYLAANKTKEGEND